MGGGKSACEISAEEHETVKGAAAGTRLQSSARARGGAAFSRQRRAQPRTRVAKVGVAARTPQSEK